VGTFLRHGLLLALPKSKTRLDTLFRFGTIEGNTESTAVENGAPISDFRSQKKIVLKFDRSILVIKVRNDGRDVGLPTSCSVSQLPSSVVST